MSQRRRIADVFDPTSLIVIVIISLPMPVFSFIACAVLFRYFKNSLAACHRLASRKARVLLSLWGGAAVTFGFYLISLIVLWESVSIVSVSGIAMRVLTFAGLCIIGIYVGATTASWLFGPKDSSVSSNGP
jgi:hypothetical protein